MNKKGIYFLWRGKIIIFVNHQIQSYSSYFILVDESSPVVHESKARTMNG